MTGERLRILFAQELGAGYGHAIRLSTIARELGEADAVFAVPDPVLVRAAIERTTGGEACIEEAPRLQGRDERPTSPDASMASILTRLGFADPAALGPVADRWRALLGARRPHLVISDFAPCLRVAMAGQVPHLAVGNGFVVPPDRAPLPLLLSAAADAAGSTAFEARVLAAANAVRRDAGWRPFDRFAQLLRGDRTLVASLPLFDPYRAVRDEPLFAPFGQGHAPAATAVMRDGPAVFCYLDARAAAVNPVLTALNRLPAPSQIFVRGIDPVELARHCAPQISIHPGPADLRTLLPRVRLVVHAGTLGVAEAALRAGTPQLLVPDTLERELTATALVETGAALVMRADAGSDPGEVHGLIAAMLADAGLREAAEYLASNRHVAPQPKPLPSVLRTARDMLVQTLQP